MFRNDFSKTATSLSIIVLVWTVTSFWPLNIANGGKDNKTEEDVRRSVVSAEADFRGKILVIKSGSSSPNRTAIEKTTVRKLGNRVFLVGKGVDIGFGDWSKGRMVWCSIDVIEEIVLFDSINEAKKAFRKGYMYEPIPAAVPNPLPFTLPFKEKKKTEKQKEKGEKEQGSTGKGAATRIQDS